VHDREKTEAESGADAGRRRGAPAAGGFPNVDTHLRLIVSHSPDLILILDPDATVRFINHPLPPLTVEDMLGTSVFDHVQGAERERCRQAFRDVLATRKPRDVEIVSEGPTFWQARIVSVSAHEGKVETVLVIATDITERKNAEEKLRRLEAQVQHTQKLESLGVLASGIAHDFNNLLTGILGSASLAAMKVPPGSPAAEQLARVVAAAEKAAELANKMLAYAGKSEPLLVPSDLNQVIEEVLPLVRTSLGNTASIQLALAPNLPAISVDPNQLQQVVVNLLTNAAEALAREIVVRTGAMTGGELSPHPSVFLEVRDDGSGMDEETRTRIFDPLFSTKCTGRGLGLSAVAGIVRGHGGKIRVESAPHRGTSFTVLFPATRPDEEKLSAPLAPDPSLAKLPGG
jgi:PAS domain S-box-containing protein